MEAFVERFRYKASKARQAQSRLKAIERLGTVASVIEEHTMGFTFPEPEKEVASPIIAIEKGSVGYATGEPVLSNLDLRIDHDDRIALLGANGNGKSTFAKLLSGRLDLETGSMTRAPGLKVGYFAQHQLDDLVPKDSAVDHVRKLMRDAPEAKVRAQVSQMGLSTEKMGTAAEDLSGGEKARLLMGLSAFGRPNLLILDEPTNHLDIDSRAALIDALNAYQGAVMLISHDRHLLEATVDRLWLVDRGTVSVYDGDLDDYRSLILRKEKREDRPAENAAPVSKSDQRKAAADRRKQLAPLRKKINEIESLTERLEKRIQELDTRLADPALYEKDPVQAAESARQRTEAQKDLARAEEEWLELSATYDEAMESD
jgi:ATP-binding cassette subfamily F protein 3